MEYKIYKHTSPSGKIYIGQTRAKNPIARWRNGGKGYFRINKHGNYQQPAMVNAINKYPWDTWIHEIIEICETQEDANRLEQYYIELYKSNNPAYGYNITGGGNGHTNQKMSEETKLKLSKAIKLKWKDLDYKEKQMSKEHLPMHENTRNALRKANVGRKCTDETKQKIREANSNPVLQFSTKGELLNTYNSATDAGEAINKTRTSITNCCKGKSKKCDNYIFLFKNDYELNPTLLDERLSNLNKRRISAIPIIQINGNICTEYPSITDASEQTGIKITSISNCLRGYSKTAGNCKWIYKNNENGN